MARRAAKKSPTKATPKVVKKAPPPKAPPKAEELIQTKSKVVGQISTELRLRMKNVTGSLDQHRAAMANLAFQRTELRLKLQEVETAEAQEYRISSELNAEMGACRQEVEKHVPIEANARYRVDLDTGNVAVES